MSFSKVNIGLRPNGTNKKAHFNLGCDSHFTSNFGRIVPIYCQELIPGSHVNLNIKSLVRLSPLAVPTAGRMHVNYYVNFVPLKEVYKPFDSFIAKRPYNFTLGPSVPTKVPSMIYETMVNHFLGNYPYNGNYTEKNFLPGYLDTFRTSLTSVSSIINQLENYFGQFPGYMEFAVMNGNGACYLGTIDDGDITLTENTLFDDDVYPNSSNYDEFRLDNNNSLYLKYGKCHRHILQLLVGLGYPYGKIVEDVSILPLLSCYYCWFKMFGIERKINIEQTTYARIKQLLIVNNNAWIEHFPSFCREFVQMYYTFAPDYFTSQVLNNADNQVVTPINYQTSLEDNDYVVSDESSGSEAANSNSSLAQVIARRLLRLVNLNTVFGKSVEKYLSSLYPGIKFDKKHDVFRGSHRININVDDVFSLADTDNATLGEYAGKAIGSGSSPSYSFDCDYQGYLIILACIVPDPGYYQAITPHVTHKSWEDFYNPEFDSLGLVPTESFEFNSERFGNTYGSYVIGLRPRYQDYKWHPNVITGSLRSRFDMDSYRGYFLDRSFELPLSGLTMDNPNLRTLNDNFDQFNLNRIFQDFNLNDDHFIVFNVIDCNVQANMIPIEDSFVDADVEKAGNVSVSRS